MGCERALSRPLLHCCWPRFGALPVRGNTVFVGSPAPFWRVPLGHTGPFLPLLHSALVIPELSKSRIAALLYSAAFGKETRYSHVRVTLSTLCVSCQINSLGLLWPLDYWHKRGSRVFSDALIRHVSLLPKCIDRSFFDVTGTRIWGIGRLCTLLSLWCKTSCLCHRILHTACTVQ